MDSRKLWTGAYCPPPPIFLYLYKLAQLMSQNMGQLQLHCRILGLGLGRDYDHAACRRDGPQSCFEFWIPKYVHARAHACTCSSGVGPGLRLQVGARSCVILSPVFRTVPSVLSAIGRIVESCPSLPLSLPRSISPRLRTEL